MSLRLAIVGRPNVGKSTLFNRLVGRRQALVDDLPGVTRDRREGEARLGGLAVTVVDTAVLSGGGGGAPGGGGRGWPLALPGGPTPGAGGGGAGGASPVACWRRPGEIA